MRKGVKTSEFWALRWVRWRYVFGALTTMNVSVAWVQLPEESSCRMTEQRA